CIGSFLTVLLVVSFSGYTLPHYLNIVFPVSAVLTSSFIIENLQDIKWNRKIYTIQLVVCFILLIGITFLNAWAFPLTGILLIVITILLLSIVFYFLRSDRFNKMQKA